MRDIYAEYRQGLITWEVAYFTANNIAATVSNNIAVPKEETEYWCKQMESLGVDAAEYLMKKMLGYKQNDSGVFFK
ncbi:MAG: hypothetical protein IKE09_02300 [Clostridiales bacterium]|nr:hypothetical protein [Clostridiales bacterium]